jgi:acetyl-CoA acyltransferase
MREAYIVNAVRTPGCRRGKGALAQTRPETLISFVLDQLVKKTPGVEKKDVEELMLGCAFPEAEQGLNLGRIAVQMAGFPDDTTGAITNRFCASGLEAIAISAMRIMAGWADVCIGAGCESMSIVPMGGNMPRPHPEWSKQNPDVYMSMGITAENVANRYKITRQMQDEFAYHSNMKAAEAQANKSFVEILPTPADKYIEQADGTYKKETFIQDFDDGVRKETTIEGLGKLKTAFAAVGSVTAGNSSQTTDGAAALLLMSEEAVKRYNVKPMAIFKSYAVAGCRADEMGVGPAYAVPKLLKQANLKVSDINIWELNEAFASQCIYAMQKLGLYDDKSLWESTSSKRIVNVNGGAIALGHPLGCTGSKLASQIVHAMKLRNAKYGVESMCIGGGMGAAALFELV